MAETRKLAAILAADVAGYSKLVGADEERTLAMLLTSGATVEGASQDPQRSTQGLSGLAVPIAPNT